MMATAKKYLFDVSFDHVVPEAEAPPVVEEKFTRAELDATRQAAFAEGRSAGFAEASAAIAAKAAAALETALRGVVTLIRDKDAAVHEAQAQAIMALRAIVAKTLPAFAAKAPLAEVEAFAAKYFREAIDEPRIVLRVANEVYEPVKSQLDAMVAATGYPGRVVLLADEDLAPGDARVEWADGGAERRFGQQLSEIDAAIARLFAPAATSNPPSA